MFDQHERFLQGDWITGPKDVKHGAEGCDGRAV